MADAELLAALLAAARPARCHDCAFHEGSPEQADAFGAWLAIQEGLAEGRPFYCHQGMPVDQRDHYCPPTDAIGHPVGFPVCAGWAAAARRRQQRAGVPAGGTMPQVESR